MDKSYLELLAENDEEARKEFLPNAKDLLTANFVEYDDHVEAHDHHPDELENQDEFQRPQGSHQAAGLMPEPEKDIHKTTNNVRYDKDVQIHVISIDSRFRPDQTTNPSNFLFKLLTPIKNVISVRLSSLEIPNTWYTFSDIRGNTSMIVRVYGSFSRSGVQVDAKNPVIFGVDTRGIYVEKRIIIQEGNYSSNSLNENDILIQLFFQLNSAFPSIIFANFSGGIVFSVIQNPISGLLTVACFQGANPPVTYTIFNQPGRNDTATGGTNNTGLTKLTFLFNFNDGIFSNRDNNWGLGYNLGFRVYQTLPATSQTASALVDVIDSNYVFLSLNPDWRVVEHNQPDSSQTPAFAKIIIDAAKNDIVYDSGQNTITKQYFLKQPTNISSFKIAIVDEYEQYVQLEGGNVSLTLEITEVLHTSLYEAMRV
jgi:hypothetical protein